MTVKPNRIGVIKMNKHNMYLFCKKYYTCLIGNQKFSDFFYFKVPRKQSYYLVNEKNTFHLFISRGTVYLSAKDSFGHLLFGILDFPIEVLLSITNHM